MPYGFTKKSYTKKLPHILEKENMLLKLLKLQVESQKKARADT